MYLYLKPIFMLTFLLYTLHAGEVFVNKNTLSLAKASVLANIKDFDDQISGEWSNSQSIDLFAKIPATYTLSTRSDGYTGGAHGYGAVGFTNYAIDTQKLIGL